MFWCVIPAAGSGRRAGGRVPKQYRPLLGKPLLIRTMERIASHPRIAGLVVALPRVDPYWPGLVMCAGKPVRTCAGGAERTDSVRSGLECLEGTLDPRSWVLVHDAARPCVSHDELTSLIDSGTSHPVGAILAAPVHDTLKRSDDNHAIDATVPRENLWRAFTPQLFRLGELLGAMRSAASSGQAWTDESKLLELQGKKPLLIEGSEDNLKITAAGDFARAERILRAQGVQA